MSKTSEAKMYDTSLLTNAPITTLTNAVDFFGSEGDARKLLQDHFAANPQLGVSTSVFAYVDLTDVAGAIDKAGGDWRALLLAWLASKTQAEYEEAYICRPEPRNHLDFGPPNPRLAIKMIDELLEISREAARETKAGKRTNPEQIYPHFWRDVSRRSSLWSARQRAWYRDGLQAIASGAQDELGPKPPDEQFLTVEGMKAKCAEQAAWRRREALAPERLAAMKQIMLPKEFDAYVASHTGALTAAPGLAGSGVAVTQGQ